MEVDVLSPDFAPNLAVAPERIDRRLRHRIIRVTRRLRAPRECVFDAWLDPGIAGGWLFATASRPMMRVTLDARVGGAFCFAHRRYGEEVTHAGKYTEIVRPRRLGFTLLLEDRPRATTHVVVEIGTLHGGCEVIVTQEDVPPECAARMRDRWTGILYGLGETLRGLPAGRGVPAPDSGRF
jgi:uncharacterized protein YndB with AHSA1/START domain